MEECNKIKCSPLYFNALSYGSTGVNNVYMKPELDVPKSTE